MYCVHGTAVRKDGVRHVINHVFRTAQAAHRYIRATRSNGYMFRPVLGTVDTCDWDDHDRV
jgi:hypothetical protein